MGSSFVLSHDGQAVIPLAILCAVLVAVIALGVKVARKRISELNQEVIDGLEACKHAWTLVNGASRLLHDERHKGRLENQAAWQAARDEWSAKVKEVKA